VIERCTSQPYDLKVRCCERLRSDLLHPSATNSQLMFPLSAGAACVAPVARTRTPSVRRAQWWLFAHVSDAYGYTKGVQVSTTHASRQRQRYKMCWCVEEHLNVWDSNTHFDQTLMLVCTFYPTSICTPSQPSRRTLNSYPDRCWTVGYFEYIISTLTYSV
jgi:hypothetical protein